MSQKLFLFAAIPIGAILLLSYGCAAISRKLLYYPTHHPADGRLTPWIKDGATIGFARPVDSPKNIWLMLPGNGGQAADRTYAIPSFSTEDSVFIMEYPGYGARSGRPSRESFNQAAKEAYQFLRDSHPGIPICVMGESIGSGPASTLATLPQPPAKLVLVVPFDRLSLVAKDHVGSLLTGIILTDDWDNADALAKYQGPVDIFGAEGDTVIPVTHAKALAAALPSSQFIMILGGHNDWSRDGRVKIRNP